MGGNQKFFECGVCGNISGLVVDKGITMMCCGKKMQELTPNIVEASTEKHLPAVTVAGDTVSVQIGSVPHPMEDSHNIGFVFLETANGGQRKSLKVGAEPKCGFCLVDDKPVAVYAYCNLHGLWKTGV